MNSFLDVSDFVRHVRDRDAQLVNPQALTGRGLLYLPNQTTKRPACMIVTSRPSARRPVTFIVGVPIMKFS